jgi:hypothetical protein
VIPATDRLNRYGLWHQLASNQSQGMSTCHYLIGGRTDGAAH